MKALILLAASTILASCAPEQKSGQPIETGTVQWLRDHDAALKLSAESGKPVFALFQEVPGCHGCQQFGATVLSHPLVVESIETDFIPLLIHNNKPGRDEEILKKYKEPAWNYQVVRFLDSKGKDLIPRKDRVWTKEALAPRMRSALKKAKRPSKILPLLSAEATQTRRVAFSQHCFWTGELRLGSIPGVISTEAGWLDGHEVTLTEYDPKKISLSALTTAAKKASCADSVYHDKQLKDYRSARESDQKKQLQGTAFAKITNLSQYQQTKLNAYARSDSKKALSFLSPRQKKQLARR